MGSDRTVRIGGAAGFWGDTETAAPQLLRVPDLDYLVFDYLAEITMSILARARMKDPQAGYATDFVTRVMGPVLPEVARRGVKVVANAGGVHPEACREALQAAARDREVSLRVAVVTGDDLMDRREALARQGVREMTRGTELPPDVASINAYLGARPIAAALDAGADVVLTGRVVDSALVLGPLLHEFGWDPDDYDRLAQGSLAGHILECGCQATGGVHTDWERVPGWDDMGFPVAECRADGSFVVTKPEGTGGCVTVGTVSEQVLYEIGDPHAYLLPDVTCDFTGVTVESCGPDRVEVRGAKGRPPPDRLKVSATHPDGFRVIHAFFLAGLDAPRKASRVGESLVTKVERLLVDRGLGPFRERRIDVLGAESTYGSHARAVDTREVVVRIALRHDRRDALELASRELAQAGTAMAPGMGPPVGGRARVSPVVRLFSFLLDAAEVTPTFELDGARHAVAPVQPGLFEPRNLPPSATPPAATHAGPLEAVPLVQVAWSRSGDKGDDANIGVIARSPELVPFIAQSLTADVVAARMRHVLDPHEGRVTRWYLPGLHAFNFLLERSLGGGGIASLRPDPQGKAFAQQILDLPIPIPPKLTRLLRVEWVEAGVG
ncbi:MAG: acyclic terpene utilization AtuA family protein [Myxococcota bacterium]